MTNIHCFLFYLAYSPALGPRKYCQTISNKNTPANDQSHAIISNQDEDQPGNE